MLLERCQDALEDARVHVLELRSLVVALGRQQLHFVVEAAVRTEVGVATAVVVLAHRVGLAELEPVGSPAEDAAVQREHVPGEALAVVHEVVQGARGAVDLPDESGATCLLLRALALGELARFGACRLPGVSPLDAEASFEGGCGHADSFFELWSSYPGAPSRVCRSTELNITLA